MNFKIPFLLFISSFLIIADGKSQFLEIGNKWIFESRDYFLGGGNYSQNIDSLAIFSDTIINGMKYFEVVASAEDPCGVFTETEYLRESEGKIYRFSTKTEQENLMIDFNSVSSYDMYYYLYWPDTLIKTHVIVDSFSTETLPSGQKIEVIYQRIQNNNSFDDNATYKLSPRLGYWNYGLLFPDIGTGLCDVYQTFQFRCLITNEDTIQLTEFGCHESSIPNSTDQPLINEINVYPNPTKGPIFIKGKSLYDIRVFSQAGLLMQSDNVQINISHLAEGIYIIMITDHNGRIATRKIIKH